VPIHVTAAPGEAWHASCVCVRGLAMRVHVRCCCCCCCHRFPLLAACVCVRRHASCHRFPLAQHCSQPPPPPLPLSLPFPFPPPFPSPPLPLSLPSASLPPHPTRASRHSVGES
jgi:hypothetical protein